MGFLDIVGTVVGSVLSGGATGLIGSAISLFAEHKKREQDLEAQRIQNTHDKSMLEAEWSARSKIADTEADADRDVQDGKTLAASYGLEPKRYLVMDAKDMNPFMRFLLGFIDFCRGIMRPGITIYLMVLTTLIYLQLLTFMEDYGQVMKSDDVVQMVVLIINTILYLATTCVLWWFGTRNKQLPPKTISN